MKILLFSRGYPTKREPLYGCFERDQAKALQKLGHEITIMSVDLRVRFFKRKSGISYFNDNGIKVYSIFSAWWVVISHLSPSLSMNIHAKLSKKLYEKIKNDNFSPDVIYAQYLWNIYYATTLKQYYNIPIVGIEHAGRLNNDVIKKQTYKMGHTAYPAIDKLITVSDNLKKSIYNRFKVDSVVIHNMVGVDFSNQNITNRNTANNTSLRIIGVGSLVYGKRYDLLIKAFAQSGLAKYNCNVKIIGDGNQKLKLQKLIKQYGLEDAVSLVGQKNKSEIIDIMNECNLFIHPSESENFSVAILEGLAMGLPVVATNCGDTAKCINKDNGILIPINNVEKLTEAIKYMFYHIDEYDNKKISENCMAKFSSLSIAKQIEQVLINAVNNQQQTKMKHLIIK